MAAIDYASTLSDLDAALGVATGANLSLGTQIRAAVAAPGATLTAVWTSAIDDAKSAWAAAASDAFDAALAAADFLVTRAGGTPAAALTFDEYDPAPIRARLGNAATLAGDGFSRRVVSAHLAALGQVDALGAAAAYVDTPRANTHQWFVGGPTSPRALELQIYAAQQDAAAWLLLVA